MLAQGSASSGNALVSKVNQFLTSEGVTSNTEALTKRLENVDIAGGDLAGFVSAVSAHMIEDLKLAADKVGELMAKGQAAMSQLVPAAPSSDAATNGETAATDGGAGQEGAKEPVKITDVRDFKASMAVSKGPTAVRDISEFEELEPKL